MRGRLLISLLGCFLSLLLTPALHRLGSVLSVEDVVPPAETASKVANELFVVNIVVVCASPEWQEVVQAPWELVTAVSINSLEQAQDNPDVHGQDVKLAGESTPHNGAANGSESEKHDLNWRSVFCGQAEGSRVLMVDLVDAFIERTPVKSAVREVVPCVFHNEEDCELVCHSPEGRERSRGSETEVLSHGVEEPKYT